MQQIKSCKWIIFWVCCCLTGLSACSGASNSEDHLLISSPFIPPTAAEPESTRAISTPAPVTSAVQINNPCSDYLSYLEDLTIPDKTKILPGAQLDKRWKVRNSGTCNWDNRYRIRLIAGPDMGAKSEQALFPAIGGSAAIIRILFIAPEEPGTYRSAWQAVNPDGTLFGDVFYIEVVVDSGEPAQELTPTP